MLSLLAFLALPGSSLAMPTPTLPWSRGHFDWDSTKYLSVFRDVSPLTIAFTKFLLELRLETRSHTSKGRTAIQATVSLVASCLINLLSHPRSYCLIR
jgi:hypothetical protein